MCFCCYININLKAKTLKMSLYKATPPTPKKEKQTYILYLIGSFFLLQVYWPWYHRKCTGVANEWRFLQKKCLLWQKTFNLSTSVHCHFTNVEICMSVPKPTYKHNFLASAIFLTLARGEHIQNFIMLSCWLGSWGFCLGTSNSVLLYLWFRITKFNNLPFTCRHEML